MGKGKRKYISLQQKNTILKKEKEDEECTEPPDDIEEQRFKQMSGKEGG